MLKMNDLVKLSQTPKSTVLYYVKEGLLPEPVKDKPNFHLYDEHCVKLLSFIKYLQSNFNATISQLKHFLHILILIGIILMKALLDYWISSWGRK